MYVVNNRYGIGDNAWTIKRIPVIDECPYCKGNGLVIQNGREVPCAFCDRIGMIGKQKTMIKAVQVVVNSITIRISQNETEVRYKVKQKSNGETNSRTERLLYNTRKEAESMAQLINDGVCTAEF